MEGENSLAPANEEAAPGQPSLCASCKETPNQPKTVFCCESVYCHVCFIDIMKSKEASCIICETELPKEISMFSKRTNVEYESPIHVETEYPYMDYNSRNSSSAGSSQDLALPLPNSKETSRAHGELSLESKTNHGSPGDSNTSGFDPEQSAGPFLQHGALQTNAPFDVRSLRCEVSRPPSGPRGLMISILGMLQYILPWNFYVNRNPMMCHAQLKNHDPPGFLIDLPHHTPEEYQQTYNVHGLYPLENSAALYLRHSNILAPNGCAIFDGKIVGLFVQDIKNKLSRYLFPGERYSRGADDLLPMESYYLPERYLRPENKGTLHRILIGYCRDVARAFAAQLDAGFLTAPLTFDHLYLVDDPSCDSLKVPILPCTGNPLEIVTENRFFVDPTGGAFPNYGALDIAYNWAKLAICILLRGEPNFETFVFKDLIKAGIDDELLVTISACLDEDRNNRPTMRHVVSRVEGVLYPGLLH